MAKRILFCLPLFYLLIVFQSSFLVHFNIFGIAPNLVLLIVLFINLFVREEQWGISSAFAAGFYLDLFSLSDRGFFGFYTFTLLGLSLFIKIVLKRYVRFPVVKEI